MSFDAQTITFQNNPTTWLQIDGAYPSGIILGDMTLLPDKPTTLNFSTSTLTGENASGGIDKYIGHPFPYTVGDGALVSIQGPLMQSDTPYFSVYVDGTLAPFAFVDFNTDLATANAILEAIQKK